MRLTLQAPPRFSFQRVVHSHGWCRLAPFRTDDRGSWLEGVVRRPNGGAVGYRLSARRGRIAIESPGRGDAATRRLLRETARSVLNLDLDLSEFHAAVSGMEGMRWIAATGAGRLMRAPTVFEDLVKLVLTTNCTWASTVRMVAALVDRCGEAAPDGSRAFPDPHAMARLGTRGLRDHCRTGYRAAGLARLARDVATGRLDPEAWLRHPRDPDEVQRGILAVHGAGPYVAANLMRLLGLPAGLGLDSAQRSWFARVYHGGRRVSDRTIARRYAQLGAWGGLVLWCEMTREWLAEGGAPTG